MEPRAAGELFHYQVLNINTSFLWLSNNMLKTLTVFNVHPVEAYRKRRAREKVKKLSLTVAQDQSGNWGKGREEYAFAKGCHWLFKLLLRLHTAAGFYVQGLKSTTVVAYRFCAYLSLSFRTVMPGGGGTPWNSWWGCTFPILTLSLSKTRKCHFSHPFSDQAFKKLCHPSYLD